MIRKTDLGIGLLFFSSFYSPVLGHEQTIIEEQRQEVQRQNICAYKIKNQEVFLNDMLREIQGVPCIYKLPLELKEKEEITYNI